MALDLLVQPLVFCSKVIEFFEPFNLTKKIRDKAGKLPADD
jgi:hypothetical protein